ncbi:MAG: Crp/Fnr family transcriptional regulator [Gammaproteobacteria bacterium]|nr:Crp/Fnr family transcriptional regulator [Gammaproteobacteria bacterium]
MTVDARIWQDLFPALASSQDPALLQVIKSARSVALGAGATVFRAGSPCQLYLLVMSGTVRVQFMTEAGREVVLYHVAAGESCILTTSCLLGSVPYPADGITESEVTAVAIEASEFERVMNASPDFRSFVFQNVGRRFAEVIGRMTEIAFGSIDGRLARALLDASGPARHMELTHQTLATELGSAREVISRHLKTFEQRGWVRLGRGSIELLDYAALQHVASDAQSS